MSANILRRGRPRGSSQYPEDRETLEHMYRLVRAGERLSTALNIALAEMKTPPRPRRDQAEQRLRKKFRPFRAEKDAESVSRPTPSEPQAFNPYVAELLWQAQLLKQAQQHMEFLRTPAGNAQLRIMKDQARWLAENKHYVRELAARLRSGRKP